MIGALDTMKPDEPMRQCIVGRVSKPQSELIRFAKGPDGVLYPDLKASLPGRGVWVSATRRDVDTAVRKGLFARSLKAKLIVRETLADEVEDLLLNRTLSSLGFAAKAGLVVTGMQKVLAALQNEPLLAVFIAEDASEGSIRKMTQKIASSDGGQAPIVDKSLRSEHLDLALGRQNVIHAALKQGGASNACLKSVGVYNMYRGWEASAGA